jgi:hypothetical protein
MLVRSRARDVLRITPHGWKLFRALEQLYPLAVNNAVLGSEAGHPFVARLVERIAASSPQQRAARFGLGTHLLQDAVREYEGPGLRVVGPAAFYPLGPEISQHWFRITRKPDLDAVLYPETKVVHWYASVRTKRIAPRIDARYVRQHANCQLFARLALPFVD